MEESNKRVYLDSISTTYCNREVLAEMLPVFNSIYGNPNSEYSFGRDAKKLLDDAREKVAKGINADANEIYFTSCGTEANNWAILGLARANKSKGKHIVVSKIEQASIIEPCKELEKEGFEVTYIGCDNNGVVSLSQLMGAIKPNTILVSIQVANSQVGTIQNLNAIARTVKEKDIVFHCDAINSLGAVPLDVKVIPIDAMSISSHKIYGPKGAGALFVKKGVKIDSLLIGGNEESGKRAGIENVASIVGFGKAVEISTRDITLTSHKLRVVRDYFVKKVMEEIDGVKLVGHQYQRLSSVANLCFECVNNQCLATMLDMQGIACSYSTDSYVLKAMDLDREHLNCCVRFSIAKNVTKDDIDYVVDKLVDDVKKLRILSPLRKSSKEGK